MVGRHSRGIRHDGSEESVTQKLIAVAAIATVLAGLGFIFYLFQDRQQALAALDPDTYCPKRGPSSVVSVLIDRTDALAAIQEEALRRYVLVWAQEVPIHGAFNIYQVGFGGELLTPVVSVCNPGDGSGLSSFDSNPVLWKKRYEDKFMAPIVRVLREMTTEREAATSPILEGIQAISVRDFGPDSTAADRHLIIVSDLLQHTGRLSLYRGIPNIETFARSSEGRALQSQLDGVNFSIYLLNRRSANDKQTDALGEFWIQWLQRQGAVPSGRAFVPLPG